MATNLRFDRNSIRQITRDYRELNYMLFLMDAGYLDDVTNCMKNWRKELKALKAKRQKQTLDKGK